MEASWSLLGVIWELWEAPRQSFILGAVRRILGPLGALLEPSWSLLGRSWESLGEISGVFEGDFEPILELGKRVRSDWMKF